MILTSTFSGCTAVCYGGRSRYRSSIFSFAFCFFYIILFSLTYLRLFSVFLFIACGIMSAAEESNSYDTNDIEEQKIVSQSLVWENI